MFPCLKIVPLLFLSLPIPFIAAQEVPFSGNPPAQADLGGLIACNFIETNFTDPDWAIATSDRILRANLCLASPPCDAELWYEQVESPPCYSEVRFWKLNETSRFGMAFSMAALGQGTFDGLYIREGFRFQLYAGIGEDTPFGDEMSGPMFVSIDHWLETNPACDGFEPNTFFVTGEAGALANYSIKVSPDEDLDPKICFYVDCPTTAFSPGHTFLELIPGVGEQMCESMFYGFYPSENNYFGGPGRVQSDRNRNWDYKICYPVSKLHYNIVKLRIRNQLDTPPIYHLIEQNCTDWIVGNAYGAGVNLPATENSIADDPFRFWASLISIGDGGNFEGGTVEENPEGLQDPQDLVGINLGIPQTLNYNFVSQVMHNEANSLASNLGLVYRQEQLGAVNTQAGSVLNIGITGAVNDAVISVSWGDGTPLDLQNTSPSHAYEAGSYTLSIGILNSGAVNHYQANVNVSDEVTEKRVEDINISVPQDPPGELENPGYEAPIFPETLPVDYLETVEGWPSNNILLLIPFTVTN